VKHFKEGNGHHRSAAMWSTENCYNWTQQAKNQRAHQIRPKDNSQRSCSAASSGAPCDPEDDGDFGISESLFPLGSPFAYGYRGTQMAGNCSPIHPTVQIWPSPQTTTCSDPWKITWKSPLQEWRGSPGSRAKLVARSWNGLLPQMHL
jgi:hypothetical protein